MDQYFEITPESVHHKEYMDYLTDLINEGEAIKQFANENGIEDYGFSEKLFLAKTGTNEVKTFEKQLAFSKRIAGYIPFRKNSKIGKAFADLNIKHAQKPFVPFFFKKCGNLMHTRIFEHAGKVYCSIETDLDEKLDCPKDFIEMKASEFFKIIEEIEEEI